MFGHGSSIDELREDAKARPWEDPKEFLADTFAGSAEICAGAFAETCPCASARPGEEALIVLL